jgi:arylsulfatase A-like enzyme
MQSLPNILLIITDQHRADHLGCYGNAVVRTPNIDGLAARGIAFDRFYVASPVCMPNRATLMTGRMPSLHGVRSNGIPLSLEATVFTDMLRAGGYRTAMIGKSHLQNMLDAPALVSAGEKPPQGFEEARHERLTGPLYDQERKSRWAEPAHEMRLPYYGFDHVELCDEHGDLTFGHYGRWLAARVPEPERLRGRANAMPDPRIVAPQAWRTRVPEELYSTSYIAERTEAFLAAQAGSEAPFFLKCSFPDPHHPFTPPGRYWDMYDPEEIEAPATCRPPGDNAPPHLKWLHAERQSGKANLDTPRVVAIDANEARQAIALTYGMITMIDDAVGRILLALERHGLAESTIIVFTSDHGDFMGDHGLLFKHPLHYQGLIRVPFIWAEPGARAAQRCEALAGTLDIARTVLARAGIAPANGMEGRSLLPHVEGDEGRVAPDALLIEEEGQRVFGGFATPVRCRTLVTQRWRMTLYDGVSWGELYDLAEDPQETHNLWAEAASRGVRAELTERLTRAMIASCDRSPLPTGLA